MHEITRSTGVALGAVAFIVSATACKRGGSSAKNGAKPRTDAPARYVIGTGDGKFGLLDKEGKQVATVDGDLDDIKPFSEGRAVVKKGDSYGYIDTSGKIVVAPRYLMAEAFHSGLAKVVVPNTGDGYIDEDGRLAIEAKYSYAGNFNDGVAVVSLRAATEGLPMMYLWRPLTVIDTTGKTVLEGVFGSNSRFSDGLAPASKTDGGTFGYVDKAGKFVIAPQFGMAFPFSEGLARVCVSKFCVDDVGFVDKTGKVVIAPNLPQSEDFSNGLALVTVNDEQSYFIGKSGAKVFDVPAKHSAESFHDNRAMVASPEDAEKQECWYVDPTGKAVGQRYYQCENFDGGLAWVILADETTNEYVDASGKVVWSSMTTAPQKK